MSAAEPGTEGTEGTEGRAGVALVESGQESAQQSEGAAGAVRLRLPGVLRDLAAGASELRLAVPHEGASLADVLTVVDQDWPALGRRLRDETGSLRRHVNVFADGEDVRRGAGLETCLRPGCVVLVLPSVAGG